MKKAKKALDENEDSTSITTTKPVEWSAENELILVEWGDAAQCYKWLNAQAHSRLSYMHAWFTIPAITLSTITGTASFAQTSLPESYRTYAPMVIGSINIFIGILTTVQQYLKISELNEAHRVAAISWDKFSRNIRIELAKAPIERMDAAHFLKLNRHEFDRLMETSPSIPIKIIDKFNSTFMGKEGSIERQRYEALKKPDICDIIISANENRYRRENTLDATSLEINDDKETAAFNATKTLELQELCKNADKSKTQTKQIDDYVHLFYNIYGRHPLKEEMIDHFIPENETIKECIDAYDLEQCAF